jgi:hypothetical protein
MAMESNAMTRTVVIKGHKTGPNTVELDQPLPAEATEVEVVARIKTEGGGKLSDYIRSLPLGTRAIEDINRQVDEERDSWNR